MAVPKRRTTRHRKGNRRAHNALELPAIDACPQCHSPKLAHHACRTCGMYEGRQAVEVGAKKKT